MKASLFNVTIHYPEKDSYLIYNTRTQAFAIIDNNTALKLTASKNGANVDFNLKDYNTLLANGFCIQDNDDEKDIIDKWLYSHSINTKVMNVTLLTTFLCNFSCNYCFEKKSKHKIIDMSYHTADMTIKWLENKIKNRNVKNLNLFFYGGEPLLNRDIIYYTANKLQKASKKLKFEFSFGIITNGYLINKEDNENLKSLGLDFYRITIDGAEKWHNKERFLKGNKPTFQKIVKNIMENTNGTKVLISGNYKKETANGIFELIDYLKNHPIRKKIHSISFSPIMNINLNSCNSHICNTPQKENLIDIELEIAQKIDASGFKNSRFMTGMMTCPFKIKDMNLTITPDGKIYKCPGTIGYTEYSVGSIVENELNTKNDEILNNKTHEKCYPCEYLPLCAGGCYLESLIEKNDLFGISCPKEKLDKTFKYSLIKKYENNYN